MILVHERAPVFIAAGKVIRRVDERAYHYLGDRLTDPALKGKRCRAVLRRDGKCILGGRSAQLVLFDGEDVPRAVLRRRLRVIWPVVT